jgi:hypothetical protein
MANAGLATEHALALHFGAGFIAGSLIGAAVASNKSAFRFALVVGGFFVLYLLLTQGAGVLEGKIVGQLLDVKTASTPFIFGFAFGLYMMFDQIRNTFSQSRSDRRDP